jgi:hypothetical protein
MNPADKFSIHELLARSLHGLDQRDPPMIEACFTEDATFVLKIKGVDVIPPFEGRDTIMQLMIDSMNDHNEDRRHVLSKIFFQSESDDSAVVVSTLVAFQAENGEIGVMTSGVYTDQVIKTGNDWLISQRNLVLDVPF